MNTRSMASLATIVMVLFGCGRSAEDRVLVEGRIYDRVYREEPVGPTYGVVLVRRVPEAIYEAGGVQITGGQRPYLIQPSAWRHSAELATSDSAVADVHAAMEALTGQVADLERRIADQRVVQEEHERRAGELERREQRLAEDTAAQRARARELYIREQRILQREGVRRRWSTQLDGEVELPEDELPELEVQP